MRRRQFIVAAGTGAVAGLAGCSDSGDSSDGPEAVVEEFFDAAKENQDDPEAFVEEASGTLHSESPLRGFLEFFLEAESSEDVETSQNSLEGIETEVTSEDLGADEIQQQFGGGGMMQEVSDELINSIAAENAIVESVVENEDGSTQTDLWLVTKEDGEWVIFVSGGA